MLGTGIRMNKNIGNMHPQNNHCLKRENITPQKDTNQPYPNQLMVYYMTTHWTGDVLPTSPGIYSGLPKARISSTNHPIKLAISAAPPAELPAPWPSLSGTIASNLWAAIWARARIRALKSGIWAAADTPLLGPTAKESTNRRSSKFCPRRKSHSRDNPT